MYKRIGLVFLLLLSFSSSTVFAQAYPTIVGDKYTQRYDAAQAVKGSQTAAPDLTFAIKVPTAGTYVLYTRAIPLNNGADLKKDETGKVGTSYVKIQIDGQRPTNRIFYDFFGAANQTAGKFEFNGAAQQLKIWLPKGFQLGHIELKNYNVPPVPLEVQNYTPKIVPPSAHPRLWVNQASLPVLRARMNEGDNKAAWLKVSAAAKAPFKFDFDPLKETFHREDVEKAAEGKAFYYLMTGDKKVGAEAVRLMVNYLTMLEFGNVKYGDITREVGRAIYTGALVYDWCHDLIGKKDKQLMYDKLLLLAREMEIGWPPFEDSIINGHGNEAQISRDLLSMSIALYEVNPDLYKYASYTVLEQLVPMRKFEYESPRHNQGVDYGAYRFGWEMYAAWLYYRMSGQTVFDDNIKNLPYYWLYMRLPDGYMLRDGDMFSAKFGGDNPLYWKQPQTMLLSYAYSNDALIKGEFEREGGIPDNPVLFLLVNDPKLKADHDLTKLPLSKDFGKVLGGVVARTGWDNSPGSKDVIAEIKGGGYHFANHQQADAGSLQIFYHGIQVGDIGLYLSYGTPYDFNFNKRSIAHSMMLAKDPEEKLLFRTKVVDGGTRFNQRFPKTPEETTTDPWFDNGKVLSADFGPSKIKPSFSYFKADLTGAYTSKMSNYTRGFCFLNMNREDVPAIIVLTDDMTTSKPEFQKYWQINTLHTPEQSGSNLILNNELNGLKGKTHVNMLVPRAADRKVEILSGKAANSTFGQQFEISSPKAEARAQRIMVSPKKASAQDKFLTVFQMTAENAKPLPVDFKETDGRYQIVVADRMISMAASSNQLNAEFTIDVPGDKEYEVVLMGIKSGFWNVKSGDNQLNLNVNVLEGKNTLYFKAKGGKYRIVPGRSFEGSVGQ